MPEVLFCDKTSDPVQRRIRALTAEEFAAWLVQHRGLPEVSAETVIINLREQFQWHRLQGRLDRRPALAILARLWGLRQSVRCLERPNR